MGEIYAKLPRGMEPPAAPRNATVLINPAARGVPPGFDGSRVARYLGRNGIEARVVVPLSKEDAREQAAESAGRGDDLLFVLGGDGSLREAAAGLAGSRTALAALPGGTVNVWAKEVGIPQKLRRALDAHIRGQVVPMDLGRGDGECFLLMAGIGWDASIVRDVSPKLKRLLGDLAYIAQGARVLPGLRALPTAWRSNNGSDEAPLALMILGNTRLYGGRVEITRQAMANDGALDMMALCPESLPDALRLALKLARGRLSGDQNAIEQRVQCVRIETPGLAVQFDGDYAGETPMEFRVEPGALRVSLPPGELPGIFAR